MIQGDFLKVFKPKDICWLFLFMWLKCWLIATFLCTFHVRWCWYSLYSVAAVHNVSYVERKDYTKSDKASIRTQIFDRFPSQFWWRNWWPAAGRCFSPFLRATHIHKFLHMVIKPFQGTEKAFNFSVEALLVQTWKNAVAITTSECSLKRIGNTAVIFCGCQIHKVLFCLENPEFMGVCGGVCMHDFLYQDLPW